MARGRTGLSGKTPTLGPLHPLAHLSGIDVAAEVAACEMGWRDHKGTPCWRRWRRRPCPAALLSCGNGPHVGGDFLAGKAALTLSSATSTHIACAFWKRCRLAKLCSCRCPNHGSTRKLVPSKPGFGYPPTMGHRKLAQATPSATFRTIRSGALPAPHARTQRGAARTRCNPSSTFQQQRKRSRA